MVAVRRLWVATSGEIPVLIQRRPNSAVAERCRSGRTGRSRKPLSLLRGTEGSNPSLSAMLFNAKGLFLPPPPMVAQLDDDGR